MQNGSQAPYPSPLKGHIDLFAWHGQSGGWVFCGWTAGSADALVCLMKGVSQLTAEFEGGEVLGAAIVGAFDRDDLKGIGTGILVHVAAPFEPLGQLISIRLEAEDRRFELAASKSSRQLRDDEISVHLIPLAVRCAATASRMRILNYLRRRPFSGEDTLSLLNETVYFEIDELVHAPGAGAFVMGWALHDTGAIKTIRVGNEAQKVELASSRMLRTNRPDVIDAIGGKFGFTDPKCGFVAYCPEFRDFGPPTYLEIETAAGALGHRPLPRPRLKDLDAIKRVLESFEVRWTDVTPTLANVIGPGVLALNRHRLNLRPSETVIDLGRQPISPRYTVLVPLYGRMDFLQYQIALMAPHIAAHDYEFLYVLDDPPKRRALEVLAESVVERFGVSLRLIILDRNVGFAPANNIGLKYARGKYLCFLNSDVFPGTPDWMPRLCRHLERQPKLGVVGPLLLFEDGTVQHEGIEFEPIGEFGALPFPIHTRKGLRPSGETGLSPRTAITGACMVMRTEQAKKLGGFDEAFVVGDFEDTDLCLKVRQLDLEIALDQSVFLYHLERKSQTAPNQLWRLNATLCNAWVHAGRWASVSQRLR